MEDWTAVLTGRLDGCVEREPGHWLIEELKSTNLAVDGVRPSGYAFERDRRQLLGYCYLWRRLGHGRVSGALVYVDIETGEEISLHVPFDDEVEREVDRRLSRSLAIWKAQRVVRRRKAQAAERLPFPHTAPRPIQEKIMEAVRTALKNGENLIAEAPTGSGKTAAALHPAMAAGLTSGRQVVFLTSKTLQQKMAVSALVAMNERAFHTVQVRAKERMCANDRILCHEEFCRFAKDYPAKMERSNILGRLHDSYAHLDPETVFEEARREEVCPFEVQLEVAQRADAIVADYNYVFEPAAALRHLTGEDLREAILLIDEAHNLPDRARQIFSPEILEADLANLRNRLLLQPGELFQDLASSVEELLEILAEKAEELPEDAANAIVEVEPPSEAVFTLRVAWEEKLMPLSHGCAATADITRSLAFSIATARRLLLKLSSWLYLKGQVASSFWRVAAMNSPIVSTVILAATSPAAWPPIPSATTKRPSSLSNERASSLCLRFLPTSVRPKTSIEAIGLVNP